MNAFLDSAEGRDALVAQGMEPGNRPAGRRVTDRIRVDIEKWRGVVAKAGIRAE